MSKGEVSPESFSIALNLAMNVDMVDIMSLTFSREMSHPKHFPSWCL